ncbi:type II secretion system F family protein [Aminobacter sp. NyZ550]|jgi:tight adherence protein C|uniref:Tight adherence protein C n=2 Tax=Aminobacter TaxID=31988 RepID=A0AAC8YTR6_AMIAI|nr:MULTISPECIES: type II secretion system F family protein [Aminobacter]AMS44395.1 type II secretion system protein [Aminobacter aminovorans]MBA8908390.1 tight adherence protein C [Aminobacter ciceronei]MBA9022171.1 tight adherence protein C [Aminobacter ciceronei]MBB3708775.1 tight adherence protein C [Aminobacter aminovorans]MRX34816.1 type II secretion system F family protein [Aminobacter sp. MDW-2]
MTDQVVKSLTDPSFLIALLVAIAVFATVFTVLPSLSGNPLKGRMKAVALERDELRAKQRMRLAAEADRRHKGLREQQSIGMRNIVERLDLRRALVDEATLNKLKIAGFRGQNPLTRFLFFRLVLPFVGLMLGILYIFVLGAFPDKPFLMKVFICIVLAYAGFYAPVLYVNNRATKRKQSIQAAWPDALDLLLICVESGMSVESALRKVADEIGAQSVDLAEEFVLTNAELSYLTERRQAYENLAGRTGLDSVKSITQALIQAERYGTPVAHALRVLAAESRDMRMNAAEKKAAALPPKLTVPMILFFLPVLFAVILGPAGMQISERGLMGDKQQSSSE